MSVVINFVDVEPPARFDDQPWTDVRIEEAAANSGSWALIDTITFTDIDSDPANPKQRSFSTSHGTAPAQWYRLTYVDAASATSTPGEPMQNVDLSVAYATTDDLFRVLKKSSPSTEQTDAAQGDLDTATFEINQEIDWRDPPMLTAEQLALIHGVCIDRAADLWRHRESAPGIAGILDEAMPTTPGRYSFARYVARLSAVKELWGIA